MKSSALTWACRALWLLLPVTIGEIFAAALEGGTSTVRIVWQVFLWATWALMLGAYMVQLPGALTVVRIGAPLAPVLGASFALVPSDSGHLGVLGVAGLVVSAAVAVLTMSGDVGEDFLDGASYGDEHRLGLRPPGFLIVGPLQLLWALMVAPTVGSVALVASGKWVPALGLGAVAVAADWYGYRLINRLSERCLVIVPAGLTLVDPLTLAEPTLFRRDDIVRLGPALVSTGAFDLTAGASGLILSIDFASALSIVPAGTRGAPTEATEVGGVLLAPSRPGRLLELAEGRRIQVERA